MRGLASTRGFPNCAMSLSVIDRFASAINTRHQALATPYSFPSLSYSLPSTDHPRIYSLSSSLLRLNHPPTSTAFIVVIPVCMSLPLFHYLPLSLSLSTRGGKPWPSKERQRANMALFPPSLGPPSTPLSTCFLPPSRLLLLLPAPSFLPPLSNYDDGLTLCLSSHFCNE